DVLALVAASAALNASKIPFTTPVAAVRVGRVQDKWLLNPTFEQLQYSDMEIVVAGGADFINMVEGGALEVSEEDMVEALRVGQNGIKELIAAEEELVKQMGKERPAKMQWVKTEIPEGVSARVNALANDKIKDALNQKDKHGRIEAVEKVKKEIAEQLLVEFPDNSKDIKNLLGDVEYNQLRSQVLDTGFRVDGRKANEVRQITIDTGVI